MEYKGHRRRRYIWTYNGAPNFLPPHHTTAYDGAWETFCSEENQDFEYDAREKTLEDVLELFRGEDIGTPVNCSFAKAGRKGGQLILTNWNGNVPQRSIPRNDAMAFDDKSLAALTQVVVMMDHETADPTAKVSLAIAEMRQDIEEQWHNGRPVPGQEHPEDDPEP